MIAATEVRHVAAAYGLVWVLVLAYVVILNAKLGRMERQVEELAGLVEREPGADV